MHLLTGRYERFRDVHYRSPERADFRFLGARFEAQVPTAFEGLRKQ